ncbi:mycothiol synthase [Streptomyces spiramenti]|uniref:Mycothiol acetyltransferase n=1 Tax=Streptomyces spiramenti TaxID=2720606 RepID=A0ABX1ASK4_9ACTN|nr:mycothiol synthase [Streptomyces spiramenti]NJP67728.1 mycothiol synthase [Streptomyces spiramenti]
MSDVTVVDEVSAADQRDAGELIDAGARLDGQSAVSEQGRLLLRGGPREGVRHVMLRQKGELVAYGQLDGTDRVEAPAAELVVHPDHRGRGHGRAVGEALLAESGRRVRIWAHGGHPAARHLAQSLGLHLFRELWQLRRPLEGMPLPEPVLPDGIRVRHFVPGRDEEAWLELNAAAFAHHPEQGSLTRRDLSARMGEAWFDPAGFFLAVREKLGADGEPVAEELLGFHWTKVHTAEGVGEIYVLGVGPGNQGLGLGKALTLVGLRYLAHDRGLPEAMLYVDADNTAAVRLYQSQGFATRETDLMYRTES